MAETLMASRGVFHFDEFALDVGRAAAVMAGVPTPFACHRRPGMCWLVLVRQSGRLVTKDELLAHVWPGVVCRRRHSQCSRGSTAQGARRRHPAFPAYIETVVRSGYRFITPRVRVLIRLTKTPRKPLTPRAITRPVELYELVGCGRSHLLSGSYFELPSAVDAFRSAIEIDPTYAPAHMRALARARCQQAAFRAVPHQEAFAVPKASALRALAMDSASAGRSGLPLARSFLSEWDWAGAEAQLATLPLEINPDHTEALLQYGSAQDALGRLDDGLRCKQQALARDPRSPGVMVQRDTPSRIGISGSTTRRKSGLGELLRSTRSMCWPAKFITRVYWEDRGRQ